MHTLYGGLKLSEVRHIIITHSHHDHFAPDDLYMICPPFAYPKENQIVNIYGNEKVYERLQLTENKAKRYDKYLRFNPIHLETPFKAGEAKITPLLADHGNGDEICHIFAVELNSQCLLYGHDTGYFPERTWDALRNFKLDGVILDCTCGKNRCERGHMGISTNVRVKERLIKQGSADNKTVFIITHYSHNCNPLYDEMVKLANDNGFIATYDGMEITI
jgi:phosphoribosyl 1,2-cyclic phosphate phosphodiesterase